MVPGSKCVPYFYSSFFSVSPLADAFACFISHITCHFPPSGRREDLHTWKLALHLLVLLEFRAGEATWPNPCGKCPIFYTAIQESGMHKESFDS